MYYLRPREFLGLAIICSILFVPIIIVSIILCIISFEIKAIINFLADDNNNWLGKTIADYGSSGIISGLSEFLPI